MLVFISKYVAKWIMLTVSCGEVSMDCDYVCKGETEEEIMQNANNMQFKIIISKQKKYLLQKCKIK